MIAAALGALGLVACGRKGPLEMPPGPAMEPPVAAAPAPQYLPPASNFGTQPQENAGTARSGFDAQGNPVAAPSEKKSFILDPLLQ